jgi:hypothetical protein
MYTATFTFAPGEYDGWESLQGAAVQS